MKQENLFLISILLIFGCLRSTDTRQSGTTDTGNIPSISGRVLREDASGYAGLKVILNDESYLSTGNYLYKSGALPSTTTDKAGYFEFPMLRPGVYRVEATDGGMKSVLFQVQIGEELKNIYLKPKFIEKLQKVVGQVNLGDRHARVDIQVYGMERFVHADTVTGNYNLLLPPGRFDIRISSPNSSYLPYEFNNISVWPSRTDTLPKISLLNSSAPFYQWKHSNRITINTLSFNDRSVDFDVNFPLYIQLDSTDSGIFDFSMSNPNGSDLRFCNSNGSELPYEIEQWNSAKKTAYVWILVDTVFNRNASQYITMYSGNSQASPRSLGPDVFGTLAGTFHFSSSTNALSNQPLLSNSSSERDNLSGLGPAVAPGKIHAGVKFSEQDHLIIASPSDAFTRDSLQTYLISFWIRLDSIQPQGSRIITLGNNFSIDITSEGKVQAQFRRMSAARLSDTTQISIKSNTNDMANGKWRYVAFRITDNSAYLFIDGQVDNHLTFEISFIAYQAGPLIIGKNEAIKSMGGFTGELDELRLSPVPRSIFWNMLDFETQNRNTNIFILNKSATN